MVGVGASLPDAPSAPMGSTQHLACLERVEEATSSQEESPSAQLHAVCEMPPNLPHMGSKLTQIGSMILKRAGSHLLLSDRLTNSPMSLARVRPASACTLTNPQTMPELSLRKHPGSHHTLIMAPEPSLVRKEKQRIDNLAEPLRIGSRFSASNTSLNTLLGSVDSSVPGRHDLAALGVPHGDEHRGSILDFEHFFDQYYIEVRRPVKWSEAMKAWRGPSSSSWLGSGRAEQQRQGRHRIVPLPAVEEVVEVWRQSAVAYIWKHKEVCGQRWPSVNFRRQDIDSEMKDNLKWEDELHTPKERVLITLAQESVCHRLLWAIGDEIPAAMMLHSIEQDLRKNFPHCQVRCTDGLLHPGSLFCTLSLWFFVAVIFASAASWNAAVAAWGSNSAGRPTPHAHKRHLGPTHEELMDQFAARLLLTGSLAQFLLLQVVAGTFPLRSLHSPFQRDLGCLMACSPFAQGLCRVLGPLVALAMPLSMAIRFLALGFPVWPLQASSPWNIAALASAASLPALTLAAAWSVRSSFFSYHHVLMLLLLLMHLGASLGFAHSLEMVRWAVYMATLIVAIAFYLFTRYIREFTGVSLHKAAQLQWTCAHIVPCLGLVLAAGLEVESGFARMLMDFICTNQSVVPFRVCVRLLRNGK